MIEQDRRNTNENESVPGDRNDGNTNNNVDVMRITAQLYYMLY